MEMLKFKMSKIIKMEIHKSKTNQMRIVKQRDRKMPYYNTIENEQNILNKKQIKNLQDNLNSGQIQSNGQENEGTLKLSKIIKQNNNYEYLINNMKSLVEAVNVSTLSTNNLNNSISQLLSNQINQIENQTNQIEEQKQFNNKICQLMNSISS